MIGRAESTLRRRVAALLFAGTLAAMPAGLAATATAGRAPAVEDLLARAREAGRAGRHGAAVRAYDQAARLEPHLPSGIRKELAYQLTWAGDLGRAREEFRRALADDPGDYDLRLGELLVVNWMGDHLAAARGYAALARRHPDRPEPWVGLAAAQDWSGRRDLALASARTALGIDPRHRDAVALRDGVRRGLRPMAGVFYDGSEDSDDYRVNGLWAEVEASPHPQLRLVPFANRLGIRHPASAEIDETWVGLTAGARPATRLGLWARAAVLADPAEGADAHPVTGTISADWTFTDRFRAGVSAERFAAVSVRTLPEKITGHVTGAFLAARPDWLSRVELRADHARYDELSAPAGRWPSNRRWNLSLAASRQVWAPARLRLGVLGRYLAFDRDLDNGIWTPERFRAAAATVEWNWGTRDVWSISGGAEIGAAREANAETSAYLAYRLGLFRAVGSFLLDLTAGHSEGNVETGTGYDRSYLHLGLRRRF